MRDEGTFGEIGESGYLFSGKSRVFSQVLRRPIDGKETENIWKQVVRRRRVWQISSVMNISSLTRSSWSTLIPSPSLRRVLATGLCSVLLFGNANSAEIAAHSEADFSAEQGQNSWRYLLWNPAGQLHELPLWDEAAKQWKEGDGAVWAAGMHPHSTEWYVVREWTAPADGDVVISGSAELFDEADGVTLRILSEYDLHAELWTVDMAAGQRSEFSVKAKVKKGGHLLFLIIGKEGIRKDATAWTIEINPAP